MEWISVKDKMPKSCQWVLVVYKSSIWQCLKIEIAYFRCKNWYTTEARYSELEGVTHWMPLPEPPNG